MNPCFTTFRGGLGEVVSCAALYQPALTYRRTGPKPAQSPLAAAHGPIGQGPPVPWCSGWMLQQQLLGRCDIFADLRFQRIGIFKTHFRANESNDIHLGGEVMQVFVNG